MGKLKRLAGETVLYGLGSMLPRFLNFLLVTLHTDVFYPEEYGILSKILAYVAVFNVVFTCLEWRQPTFAMLPKQAPMKKEFLILRKPLLFPLACSFPHFSSRAQNLSPER